LPEEGEILEILMEVRTIKIKRNLNFYFTFNIKIRERNENQGQVEGNSPNSRRYRIPEMF
jgi:hypothetical protein